MQFQHASSIILVKKRGTTRNASVAAVVVAVVAVVAVNAFYTILLNPLKAQGGIGNPDGLEVDTQVSSCKAIMNAATRRGHTYQECLGVVVAVVVGT